MKLTRKSWAFALGLMSIASFTKAENIGEAIGKEQEQESGNYFEIGISAVMFESRIDGDTKEFHHLSWQGRYEYNGLFVEKNNDSVGVPGFAIGYELWENRDWAVDIVAIPLNGLDIDNFDRLKGSSLQNRNAVSLTGMRATRFFDDFILQAHVLPLGKGAFASFAAGKLWQVDNWSLSAFGALSYASEKLNDQLWSVTEQEASETFPQFDASNSVNASLVLRAEYPLSENWVFQAETFAGKISSGIGDSPIFEKDTIAGFNLELKYVF